MLNELENVFSKLSRLSSGTMESMLQTIRGSSYKSFMNDIAKRLLGGLNSEGVLRNMMQQNSLC